MEKEKVILKKGKEKIAQLRHHWIFSGAIHSFPEKFKNGCVLPFYSFDGQFLGQAYFNKNTSLSGRVLSFDTAPFEITVEENIKAAFRLREKLFQKEKTNAYRLIHAEGDFLPGLIVDRYDEILVMQIGTLGMDLLKDLIIKCLCNLFPVKGIYEKSLSQSRNEESLPPHEGIVFGEVKDNVMIKEEGLTFVIPIKKGQKTGFFLDQKEMRILIGSLSSHKKVLNCFSYTGGFTIHALKQGAAKVDSVDVSSEALEIAKENLRLNQLPFQENSLIAEDVFTFLRGKKELDYDIVILDPPAFAKKKNDIEMAAKGYKEINAQAMEKMKENALLFTCSCSYFIDDGIFRTILFQAAKKAKRDVKIISSHRQSLDHPINIYHREGEYLKGYLLSIGKKHENT